MKKLITTFAAVGVLGLSACGPQDRDTVIIDDPVLEESPQPVIIEPTPPLGVDTMVVDTAPGFDGVEPLPPQTDPVTPPADPQ